VSILDKIVALIVGKPSANDLEIALHESREALELAGADVRRLVERERESREAVRVAEEHVDADDTKPNVERLLRVREEHIVLAGQLKRAGKRRDAARDAVDAAEHAHVKVVLEGEIAELREHEDAAQRARHAAAAAHVDASPASTLLSAIESARVRFTAAASDAIGAHSSAEKISHELAAQETLLAAHAPVEVPAIAEAREQRRQRDAEGWTGGTDWPSVRAQLDREARLRVELVAEIEASARRTRAVIERQNDRVRRAEALGALDVEQVDAVHGRLSEIRLAAGRGGVAASEWLDAAARFIAAPPGPLDRTELATIATEAPSRRIAQAMAEAMAETKQAAFAAEYEPIARGLRQAALDSEATGTARNGSIASGLGARLGF
jgi:hypothetical protein